MYYTFEDGAYVLLQSNKDKVMRKLSSLGIFLNGPFSCSVLLQFFHYNLNLLLAMIQEEESDVHQSSNYISNEHEHVQDQQCMFTRLLMFA